MIRLPSFMTALPYLIGAAFLFIAGGEIIGGYKVAKLRKEHNQIQSQIVRNAVDQARELAQKWEEENAKAQALKRELGTVQAKLRTKSKILDDAAVAREKEVGLAAEKLSACLIDEDVREILNDWMIYEKPFPGS